MLIDLNYLGFLKFGNLWGVLMVVKHTLILVMLLIGFWYNAILRVGPSLSSSTRAAEASHRFQQYANWMAITSALVLLLTALSQVE